MFVLTFVCAFNYAMCHVVECISSKIFEVKRQYIQILTLKLCLPFSIIV